MAAGSDPLALRAGDADRERVVGQLRRHHLEGRLDGDELEERLAGAYAARTVGDLAALSSDLPRLSTGTDVESGPPAPTPTAGGFGLLGFNHTHDLPVSTDAAFEQAFDSIAGAMVAFGYEMIETEPGRLLVFEHASRPTWVYVVCVVGFPFGLFALMVKSTTRVRMVFTPRPGGSRLRVSGKARRPVRKALLQLSA